MARDDKVLLAPEGPGSGLGLDSTYKTPEQLAAEQRRQALADQKAAEDRAKADRKAEEKKGKKAERERLSRDRKIELEKAQQLRRSLTKHAKAHGQQLENILRRELQQYDLTASAYTDNLETIRDKVQGAEQLRAGTLNANASNLARERTAALSEATSLGAGETDKLRAQQMSLRNWHSSQAEAQATRMENQITFDSQLTDLNTQTRERVAGIALDHNNQRENTWNNYYDEKTNALLQIGNIYGASASQASAAMQNDGGKAARQQYNSDINQMSKFYRQGVNLVDDHWENPGSDASATEDVIEAATKGLPAWARKGARERMRRTGPGQIMSGEYEVNDLGEPEGRTSMRTLAGMPVLAEIESATGVRG